MAVIVHDDMPIEQALNLLWRESNRENIPDVLRERRYRVKPSHKNHEIRKEYKKRKKRRRAAKRRLAKKGKV